MDIAPGIIQVENDHVRYLLAMWDHLSPGTKWGYAVWKGHLCVLAERTCVCKKAKPSSNPPPDVIEEIGVCDGSCDVMKAHLERGCM